MEAHAKINEEHGKNLNKGCFMQEVCNKESSAMEGLYYWCPGVDCPKYLKHDCAKHLCVTPECPGNEVAEEDGSCGKCPEYQAPPAPDPSNPGKSFTAADCGAAPCDPETMVATREGECVKCSKYSRPLGDGRTCIQSTCDALQILLEDGRC